MNNRPQFLRTMCAALVASRTVMSRGNENQRPRRILLRSSWQTVNIGDIAHTPGVLEGTSQRASRRRQCGQMANLGEQQLGFALTTF